MEEIVRRLRNRSKSSLEALKESMPPQGLLEADEDEEKDPLDISDEEVTDEVEDDSTAPEQGAIDDTPAEEDEETPEDDTVTPEDESPESLTAEEENPNPLDNSYAVNYKIGQEVVLAYSNGAKSKLKGTIEGYDKEGFYRILWGNGMTTNGITDLALLDFIEGTQNENKCVCGSSEFVNEDDQLVCDSCGRHMQENLDQLTLADKSRPKGKKLIRSEAHPVSTVMKPDIVEGKEEEDIKTVQDSIRKAFGVKKKKLSESTISDTSVFYKLKELEGAFWTRQSEMFADISDLGYEVIEDDTPEYIVVVSKDDDEDLELLIPIVGTSRTMTLDLDKAREL